MSPEQAMGDKTIDARSDIYALGAVTYEMLTGDPPFTGSSVQTVVAKVLSAEPERPTLVRKTIPAATEQAVLTGLAKLPADRFATAAEFAAALRDVAEGAAPTRSDVTSPVRVRGGRALVLATGVALGLVAGIGGVLLAKRDAAEPNANGELTRVQVTFTGIAGRPAITARGDVIAYVQRRCDQRGHEGFTHYEALRSGDDPVPCRSSLIVQDTGATTPVTVIADAPWITTLRWTPSGTSLAVDLLLRLAELLGDSARRARAMRVLEASSEPLARYASAFGHLLGVADMAVHGAVEVALAGDPSAEDFRALAIALSEAYVPSLVIAGGRDARLGSHRVALLADKPPRDGQATAYVCRQYLCESPLTDPNELPAQLVRASRSPLGVGG